MDHDAHNAGTETPAQEAEAFPPFDPAHFSGELIWLAVTFGALYFLMSRVALPRVGKILGDRKAKIDSDLATAAKAQQDAAAAAAAHEKTLAEAKAKALAVGQAANKEAAAKAEASRAALEADLNGKLAIAEQQIAATKATAMGNVDSIASDAAHAILQHITGAPADSRAVSAALAALKA